MITLCTTELAMRRRSGGGGGEGESNEDDDDEDERSPKGQHDDIAGQYFCVVRRCISVPPALL